MLLFPALSIPPSNRKITAATATTASGTRKSPNVPSASSPAVIVSDAVVELDTTLMSPSCASTIAPVPMTIDTDTIASATGEICLTALDMPAIFSFSPPLRFVPGIVGTLLGSCSARIGLGF